MDIAQGTHTNRGYAAAVGSAMSLSMTAIFIRHLTQDYGLPALVLVYWREVMAAVTLAVLAVGPTLMGFGLYNVSLRYLTSSTANLVVMIQPVFTAVFAYILFGEVLTAAQLVGGAMILGAVAVLRLGKE